MVKDAYTTWLGAYPLPNKSSEEAVAALKDFVGNDEVNLSLAMAVLSWKRQLRI